MSPITAPAHQKDTDEKTLAAHKISTSSNLLCRIRLEDQEAGGDGLHRMIMTKVPLAERLEKFRLLFRSDTFDTRPDIRSEP